MRLKDNFNHMIDSLRENVVNSFQTSLSYATGNFELKADKKAASVVGKETMKEALLEILNILVQNLMDNKPNGRSFEYNYNNIVNASHFKKRFEALS